MNAFSPLLFPPGFRYLGCVELKELQESDAVELANDLCLAALLGDGIYNMGELLSHGILDFLRDTQQQWLVDLVGAFNAGDVAG
jgi:26S proteasome regulatory subunit N9